MKANVNITYYITRQVFNLIFWCGLFVYGQLKLPPNGKGAHIMHAFERVILRLRFRLILYNLDIINIFIVTF